MSDEWKDFNFAERHSALKEMGERYGINRFNYASASGQKMDGGDKKPSYESYEKAVLDAAANDYDTRRSIEAAKMAGVKGADKLSSGMDKLSDVYEAHELFKRIHKKDMGNTGKFSSVNDLGNLTNYLVKKDRTNFEDQMQSSFKDYIEENKPEQADPVNQQAQPVERSPELQAAYSRLSENSAALRNGPGLFDASQPFGKKPANVQTPGKDQRDTAVQAFHDKYKLDLMNQLRDNPPLL